MSSGTGAAIYEYQENDTELEAIRRKSYSKPFQHDLITIDGITMVSIYKNRANEILNWEVNEEDIWICTFPKSGTTWTQEMVWMIMNNLDYKQAHQEPLSIRSPFFELSAVTEYKEISRKLNENISFNGLEDSLKRVKASKSPVCIKTHLAFNLLPRQIQDGTKKPKIIYVTRNPKDACVSYYYHQKLLSGYIGTFDDYCKLFLAGQLNYGLYWKHIFSFWNQRNQHNILFLKYEDMKNDLPAIIRKTANFLGKTLAEEQIDELANHLTFQNMQKNPAVNYEPMIESLKKHKLSNYDGKFIRSGSIGDYKTHMSPELIDKFNQWTSFHTKDSDVDIYSNN